MNRLVLNWIIYIIVTLIFAAGMTVAINGAREITGRPVLKYAQEVHERIRLKIFAISDHERAAFFESNAPDDGLCGVLGTQGKIKKVCPRTALRKEHSGFRGVHSIERLCSLLS